jgi:L-alanine-DL-glutamate epimerase-like enolase superfamily enzyme
LKPTNGTLDVPVGPGLGVEVDEAKVRDLVKKTRGAESLP